MQLGGVTYAEPTKAGTAPAMPIVRGGKPLASAAPLAVFIHCETRVSATATTSPSAPCPPPRLVRRVRTRNHPNTPKTGSWPPSRAWVTSGRRS